MTLHFFPRGYVLTPLAANALASFRYRNRDAAGGDTVKEGPKTWSRAEEQHPWKEEAAFA